jgi:hypothetical protein
MPRYRTTAPIGALRKSAPPNQQTILTIQAGSLLKIDGGPDEKGLVTTIYEKEEVAVFQKDLDERSEKLAVTI